MGWLLWSVARKFGGWDTTGWLGWPGGLMGRAPRGDWGGPSGRSMGGTRRGRMVHHISAKDREVN